MRGGKAANQAERGNRNGFCSVEFDTRRPSPPTHRREWGGYCNGTVETLELVARSDGDLCSQRFGDRSTRPSQNARPLQSTGSNLAAVLDDIKDNHPERWESLLDEFREWLPEYDHIQFVKPVEGQKALALRTKRGGHQIPASELSQGTLIALALLTLAYQPNPPSLIGLEEIDRGLHRASYATYKTPSTASAIPKVAAKNGRRFRSSPRPIRRTCSTSIVITPKKWSLPKRRASKSSSSGWRKSTISTKSSATHRSAKSGTAACWAASR